MMSSSEEDELLALFCFLTDEERESKRVKKSERRKTTCISSGQTQCPRIRRKIVPKALPKKRDWVGSELMAKQLERRPGLVKELMSDEDNFFNHFHVGVNDFQDLLELLKDDIKKQDTLLRLPVPENQRLGLTLSVLIRGESFVTLSNTFLLGSATGEYIATDVCEVISRKLEPLFLPFPTTETLYDSAERFESELFFPNCVGAIGGTHVLLKSPTYHNKFRLPYNQSGYEDCNGKYSTVLLVLADSRNCLLAADIVKPDKESDDRLLEKSELGKLLLQSSAMPNPKFHTNMFLPPVMVGDDSFPLHKYVMTPYPKEMAQVCPSKRMYNDRLFKAQKAVENTLGLMAQRFKILQEPLQPGSDTAILMIKACCYLHNFFRLKELGRTSGKIDEEAARKALEQSEGLMVLSRYSGGEASDTAEGVRENFKAYFSRNTRNIY